MTNILIVSLLLTLIIEIMSIPISDAAYVYDVVNCFTPSSTKVRFTRVG